MISSCTQKKAAHCVETKWFNFESWFERGGGGAAQDVVCQPVQERGISSARAPRRRGRGAGCSVHKGERERFFVPIRPVRSTTRRHRARPGGSRSHRARPGGSRIHGCHNVTLFWQPWLPERDLVLAAMASAPKTVQRQKRSSAEFSAINGSSRETSD